MPKTDGMQGLTLANRVQFGQHLRRVLEWGSHKLSY